MSTRSNIAIQLPEDKDGNRKVKVIYVGKYENKNKCNTCRFAGICVKSVKTKKTFQFLTKKLTNYDLILEMYEKLRTEEGRKIYSRRMPTIERVFGHIKHNLGFTVFNLKSLEKVKTMWTLLCSAHNLRRIFNLQQKEKMTNIILAMS